MTESALKRRNYAVSTILTFGIPLKALSLIYGVSFFTSRFQLHKTCTGIFQDLSKCYSMFYSFHLNVNPLISASPALLKYCHWARLCAFSPTRKLKVNCLILRVGILFQNLPRYNPNVASLRAEELCQLIRANIWPSVFNNGKIS